MRCRNTPASLRSGKLAPTKLDRKRLQSGRNLLLVHGTFSDTAGAFGPLAGAGQDFFDRMQATYGDRIYGFDHFTVSRTPVENCKMLIEALPPGEHTFDVAAGAGTLTVPLE